MIYFNNTTITMKYLKKFNESILPNVLNNRGSSQISASKFDQILNIKCKNYINNNDNTKMYRAQRHMGDYVFFDPIVGESRKSIENINIHVELIDNLPSWKGYPDYSKSVIGITGREDNPESGIAGYGDTIYELIPFDESPIVVCPSSTIWESLNSAGRWGSDIHFVYNIFDALFTLSPSTDITQKLEQLKRLEQKIDSVITDEELLKEIRTWIKGYIERDSMSDNFYKPCKNTGNWKDKEIDELKGIDIFNYINDCLFNPEVRGFELKKYNNFSANLMRQIWTSGPVIMRKVN